MSKASPTSGSAPRRRLPIWKKLLFSAAVLLSLCVLGEVSLALLGVVPDTVSGDPYVGFERQIPLLEVRRSAKGQAVASIAPNKLVWFNRQSFPVNKPSGTRRIVCVGGSTTFGRPFQDSTSFAGWLRVLLPEADPSHRWEVINAGGVSYASYRVAVVMEELAHYDPDLFIVYCGHNEFLERRTYRELMEQPALLRRADSTLRQTRIGALAHRLIPASPQASAGKSILAGEVDEVMNHTVGPADYVRDDAWHQAVVQHYRWNLQRMVSIARSAGAAIVFVVPAANEKDCSPFKGEPSADLTADQQRTRHEAMAAARSYAEADEWIAAAEQWQSALSIDGRDPAIHYGLGTALFQLDRFAESRLAFSRAIDEDVCPLRATTAIATAIREVAARERVPLVDFEARLRLQCRSKHGHECLGNEYFLDHVHPTIEAHRLLAMWIMESLGEHGLASPNELSAATTAILRDQVLGRLDPREQGVALRNLAKVLHWSGKFAEAEPRARDALEFLPGDAESRFVLADCLVHLGRREEGFREYGRLFVEHEYPPAYLPYGEMLLNRGRIDEALEFLSLAAVYEQDRRRKARAHDSLGQVLVAKGDHGAALEMFSIVNGLYPGDPVTLVAMAEAAANSGNRQACQTSLDEALKAGEADAETHYRIGEVLLKIKRVADAAVSFERAVKLDPHHARAWRALGRVREQRMSSPQPVHEATD